MRYTALNRTKMCDLCYGLTSGCPNCDDAADFEELLDIELDEADFDNDLKREREDENGI